jgi:hypothetical protein
MSQRTLLSKKEEDLSEEWGFKNAKTAELLMQRARRMEHNATQKKKFGQLDPKQRLAMFRKLEEMSKPLVAVQLKHKPVRMDYFQAMAMQEEEQRRLASAERHQKVGYTYEWVHTQVRHIDSPTPSQHSSTSSMKRGISDGNLPRIEGGMFGIRQKNLMSSPVSVEVESVDSVSISSSSIPPQRRRSLHAEKLPPLSPVQGASLPQAGAPREKISWRSPQVNKSSGWGSGKKRTVRK